MKTEKEINQDILKVTMEIEKKFPELSKYIQEMPVNISGNIDPESNIKNLNDYNDSLNALLKNYTTYHSSAIK
jgi:hypothetical protein